MLNNQFEFDLSKFSKLRKVGENITQILQNEVKELEINPLLEKIFVSRPYFAFDKVYQFEDVLIAPIKPEQPIEFEVTPMSSAEAGRHLAILGSCVFAVNENEKKYYLANKAFKRTSNDFNFPCSKPKKLYVIANAASDIKMECSANTALIDENGEIIFMMNVTYQKLTERLFNRVFKGYLRVTSDVNFNPYANNSIKLENAVELEEKSLIAELPIIEDEYCAGHFNGAPMLPIGIMSYIITNFIGNLLKKIDNEHENKYYLVAADLMLFQPTDNRNKEFVEITYNGKENGMHKISWIVKNKSGDIRNTMKLIFTSK